MVYNECFDNSSVLQSFFHVRGNREETGTTTVTAGSFVRGLCYKTRGPPSCSFLIMAESKFFAAGSSESESSASEDEQPVVTKQATISTK